MLSRPAAALNSIEVIEIYELLIRSSKQNEEPEIPICQDYGRKVLCLLFKSVMIPLHLSPHITGE